MSGTQNILVIKHGALGDIVMATAAFKAIREAFPDADIVGLTSSPYATLLAQSPYFNEIWSDRKPKLHDREGLRHLRTMFRSRPWDWVFDLQTSQRSRYTSGFLKSLGRISAISAAGRAMDSSTKSA